MHARHVNTLVQINQQNNSFSQDKNILVNFSHSTEWIDYSFCTFVTALCVVSYNI